MSMVSLNKAKWKLYFNWRHCNYQYFQVNCSLENNQGLNRIQQDLVALHRACKRDQQHSTPWRWRVAPHSARVTGRAASVPFLKRQLRVLLFRAAAVTAELRLVLLFSGQSLPALVARGLIFLCTRKSMRQRSRPFSITAFWTANSEQKKLSWQVYLPFAVLTRH